MNCCCEMEGDIVILAINNALKVKTTKQNTLHESPPFLHFCEAIILQTADSISRLV